MYKIEKLEELEIEIFDTLDKIDTLHFDKVKAWIKWT